MKNIKVNFLNNPYKDASMDYSMGGVVEGEKYCDEIRALMLFESLWGKDIIIDYISPKGDVVSEVISDAKSKMPFSRKNHTLIGVYTANKIPKICHVSKEEEDSLNYEIKKICNDKPMEECPNIIEDISELSKKYPNIMFKITGECRGPDDEAIAMNIWIINSRMSISYTDTPPQFHLLDDIGTNEKTEP